MVLDIHERHLAKQLNREPREIPENEVLKAVDECDKNNDGKITRDEMKEWVVKYMSKNTDSSLEMSLIIQKQQSENKTT